MNTRMQLSRQILEQANGWFIEFRNTGDPIPVRQQFHRWLNLSPRHIQAYAEVAQRYADLGSAKDIRALELLAEAQTEPNAVVVPLRNRNRTQPAIDFPRGRQFGDGGDGVCGESVWHPPERDVEPTLVNAPPIQNVRSSQAGVHDDWMIDLQAHGLIRLSLARVAPMQELHDLTRTRKQLVREISGHALLIQKVLSDANLKLGNVLSDVTGKSGRAIIQAMVDGERDPEKLALLAQSHARKKRAELVEALRGRIRPRHQELLKAHLQLVTALQRAVSELDAAIGRALALIHEIICWQAAEPREFAGKR
ncbi:MAG TPA: DUF4880 domain-containing protein [Terriglobales bacterium]|nr:DUF4880 domain-containing protein [Terriglobales bacterium]